MGLSWSVQVMTVPGFGVTFTLRVDVNSDRVRVGLGTTEMRVAVKFPRSTIPPKCSFPKYLIVRLNVGLFHSRLTPSVTMQVSVTTFPGQIAP